MKWTNWAKISSSSIFLLTAIFSGSSVYAQCPVCTVAVIGGVGFTRWLKIDDTISGLWVGALLTSLTLWTINWLNAKKIKFIGRKPLIVLFYYGLTIAPMYWTNFIGHPLNKVWGIDKLVFGIIIGTLIYYPSVYTYQYLKHRNGDRAHFPFEKIAFALVPEIILSLIFYLIFKPLWHICVIPDLIRNHY